MSSMSESLECCICSRTYNLSDRLPKALVCQHTICGHCLEQLKRGTTVQCPTCRQQCPVGQVAVNFALRNVLQVLCESCYVKDQKLQCSHCKKMLCDECFATHEENVHKELIAELAKLEQILRKSSDTSSDDSILDQERHKESTTINEIKQGIEYHRDALDKLEKELETQVRSTAQRNSDLFVEYMTSLNDTITKGKRFHMQTKNMVGAICNKRSSAADMISLLAKCRDLVEQLTQLTNNTPALVDYRFIKTAEYVKPLSIGKLVTNQNRKNNQQAPGACNTSELDYTSLRYHSHKGDQGSGPEQFNRPHSVACSQEHVFVSDLANSRVKIYDTELNLQFVVGDTGSGRGQFGRPSGLAVGPGGEVYVCDWTNHRITVLSERGEYIRDFGTRGSGADGLQGPGGIDIRHGHVYIADTRNYRVKVVKTDGTFVHHIGSAGTRPGEFQGCPLRVAVTGDDHVLVLENKQQLHVYSRTGVYQGLFPPHIPEQLATALPYNMTVDSADNVIIAYNTDQLAVYDKHGGFITVVGSSGSEPGELRHPAGVSVDTQRRRVVVCDWDNHRIQLFQFE